MHRIWYEPDGVKVTELVSGDMATVAATLLADGHIHPASTFEDVEDRETLERLLPSDRSLRHKWRKNPNGRGVVIDHTIPDPPDRHQELRDAVNAASTAAQLKPILHRILDSLP